jgi:hypothetical protein
MLLLEYALLVLVQGQLLAVPLLADELLRAQAQRTHVAVATLGTHLERLPSETGYLSPGKNKYDFCEALCSHHILPCLLLPRFRACHCGGNAQSLDQYQQN